MYTVLSILIIIVCLLLTLVVLIQNPKGGGIASNFANPAQLMGAKKTTDVVEKATWILAIVLIVFSLSSNFVRPSANTETEGPESRVKDQVENTTAPAAPMQQAPAPQPAQANPEPAAQPAQ